MQMATTTVLNTPGNKSTPIRMILDSGSQRTYITKKLAKNLQLKLYPHESVKVAMFGSDKPKQIKYGSTKMQITLKDGSLMLIKPV